MTPPTVRLDMIAEVDFIKKVAYTLVGTQGMTYADAMGLIVIEGVIILVLVLTGFH